MDKLWGLAEGLQLVRVKDLNIIEVELTRLEAIVNGTKSYYPLARIHVLVESHYSHI